MVPEDVLYQLATEVLGVKEFDEDEFKEKIKQIKVHGNHQVEFIMMDESSIVKTWQPKKRSEVWTPEMKEKARQRELERIKNNGQNNSNSTDNK